MGSPVLRIAIRAVDMGRFEVESKIDGRATIKRTVLEAALPAQLASLAELAITTQASRPIRPIIESPFEESIHG